MLYSLDSPLYRRHFPPHVCRYTGRHDLCPFLYEHFDNDRKPAFVFYFKPCPLRDEIYRCEEIYQSIKKAEVKDALLSFVPVTDLVNLIYDYWSYYDLNFAFFPCDPC